MSYMHREALNPGTKIFTVDNKIFVINNVIASGGSAIVYSANRVGDAKDGSPINFAIKEYFPVSDAGAEFQRIDGYVQPVCVNKSEKYTYEKMLEYLLEKEKWFSGEISNKSDKIIPVFEILQVKSICTIDRMYIVDPSKAYFSYMRDISGLGFTLDELKNEAKKEMVLGNSFRNGNGWLNINTIISVMLKVSEAVKEIHEAGYIHCDIKPNNLFIYGRISENENKIDKVSLLDFGSSQKLIDGKTEPISVSEIYSTKEYYPPDVSLTQGKVVLSPAFDIYSLGKLFLHLLTNRADKKDIVELLNSQKSTGDIVKTKKLQYYWEKVRCQRENIQIGIINILRGLLRENPEDRISICCLVNKLERLNEELSRKPGLSLKYSTLAEGEFIGRDKKIEDIITSLKRNKKPIVLYGFGGQGKTETAIAAADKWQAQGNGDTYFVVFTGDFRNTITGPIADGFHIDRTEFGKPKSEDQIYKEVLYRLSELSNDDILVIDNVENEDKNFYELQDKAYHDLIKCNCKLLFTTRYDMSESGIESIEIDALDDIDLFKIIDRILVNSKYSLSNEEKIALIEAAGRNTLVVELIAKTLEKSRGRLKAQDIINALNNCTLSQLPTKAIPSNWNRNDENREMIQRRIYEHIKCLFDLSDISNIGKSVLCYSSLLPNGGMDVIVFENALKENEIEALDMLIDRNWLKCTKENILKIHPVVRVVCREEIIPDEDDCHNFLKKLESVYNKSEYSLTNILQLAELFENAYSHLYVDKDLNAIYAGQLYVHANKYEKALSCYFFSLEETKKLYTNSHPYTADIYNAIGSVYYEIGEYLRAKEFFNECLNIRENLYLDTESHNLSLGNIYNNLGALYLALGNYDEAKDLLIKSLNIYEQNLLNSSESIPLFGAIYRNVGHICIMQKDYDEALDYVLKSLKIHEKLNETEEMYFSMADDYDAIGLIYNRKGLFDEAIKWYQEALKIREKFYLPTNPFHPDLASSYHNIGVGFHGLHKYQNALDYLFKALAINNAVFQQDHPHNATTYNSIAYIYDEMKDNINALNYYLKAFEIKKNLYMEVNPAHPELLQSYEDIGRIYYNLGEYSHSLAYFNEAQKYGIDVMMEIETILSKINKS